METSRTRLRGYIRRLLESQAEAFWAQLPQAQAALDALADALTDESRFQHTPPIAPTRYIFGLPQAQSENFRQNARLLDALAIAIHRAGHDLGLRFPVLPRVVVDSRTALPPQRFTLEAVVWEPEALRAVPLNPKINTPPPSAYFIINGIQGFSLEQPVVHIGRRPDNDLVLDDPRVSRLHAQLRAMKGRFMLFDLNSTGGTFVNGKRIRATMLYPNDVVLLAGMRLVYGERSTRPLQDSSYTDTRPQVASLNTTITLRREQLDTDDNAS